MIPKLCLNLAFISETRKPVIGYESIPYLLHFVIFVKYPIATQIGHNRITVEREAQSFYRVILISVVGVAERGFVSELITRLLSVIGSTMPEPNNTHAPSSLDPI